LVKNITKYDVTFTTKVRGSSPQPVSPVATPLTHTKRRPILKHTHLWAKQQDQN